MYHFGFLEKVPVFEVKYGKITTSENVVVPDEWTCDFVKKHMSFIDRLSFKKIVIGTLYSQDFICGDREKFLKLKDKDWKFKFNFH